MPGYVRLLLIFLGLCRCIVVLSWGKWYTSPLPPSSTNSAITNSITEIGKPAKSMSAMNSMALEAKAVMPICMSTAAKLKDGDLNGWYASFGWRYGSIANVHIVTMC